MENLDVGLGGAYRINCAVSKFIIYSSGLQNSKKRFGIQVKTGKNNENNPDSAFSCCC
jgi:hypothetical protein